MLSQSYCISVNNFLSKSEREWLLDYTLKKENDFTVSQLIPPDMSKRSSTVLYEWDKEWFVNRINPLLPLVTASLNLPMPQGNLIAQITASNDNDFLSAHPDKTELTNHAITFVYYFYQRPKPFAGGDLVLYGESEQFEVVTPIDNTLIIFDSNLWHEVLPVRCPSKKFINSRFTVNGWFNAY